MTLARWSRSTPTVINHVASMYPSHDVTKVVLSVIFLPSKYKPSLTRRKALEKFQQRAPYTPPDQPSSELSRSSKSKKLPVKRGLRKRGA